jgi:hypothetical protein
MSLTSDHAKLFARMAFEKNMKMSEYLAHYSKEFIGRMVKRLADLKEEEKKTWIEKYKQTQS